MSAPYFTDHGVPGHDRVYINVTTYSSGSTELNLIHRDPIDTAIVPIYDPAELVKALLDHCPTDKLKDIQRSLTEHKKAAESGV